jgi:hypothetical protein
VNYKILFLADVQDFLIYTIFVAAQKLHLGEFRIFYNIREVIPIHNLLRSDEYTGELIRIRWLR